MWYSADLLFQSVHGPGSEAADAHGVWEESVVLIQASSEQEANALAHRMGREREVSYKNMYNETVTWRFDSLVQLCEIGAEPPSHGSEVFSRFLKKDEVESMKSGFLDSDGQA